MEFRLNKFSCKLTDREIICDIKNVARIIGNDYVTISQYKKYGKYSLTAIQGHFGTWKHALQLCNLRTERNKKELKLISDEEYKKDLLHVAKSNSKNTVLFSEYQQKGKYSAEHLIHRFGTWNKALEFAGLKHTGFTKQKIEKQELYNEIEKIWITLGRQPTISDIQNKKISKYSIDTYRRRFGNWQKALTSFCEYINDNKNPQNFECKQIQEKQSCDTQEIEKIKKQRRTTRNIPIGLRFKVFKRDSYKCVICGRTPANDPNITLHVDHIKPWSKGGETVIENLRTLCSDCNLGKSNLE